MNILVDRPEARWLPSRHRFAITRLIAYLRLRRVPPTIKRPDHLVLSIDRDQTGAEMNCIAAWVFATTACYGAAVLPLALPLSIILAIPLAAIAIHVPIVAGGLLLRRLKGDGNHTRSISGVTMALLLTTSAYIATTPSWARFVAWFFFAIVILNCAAAITLQLLHSVVQIAEDQCAR